ncbi:hypothetical protein KM043_001825 [Ampulex compressa]|nr:hypothetical protein KM043_001825 [Ampulex compressa]
MTGRERGRRGASSELRAHSKRASLVNGSILGKSGAGVESGVHGRPVERPEGHDRTASEPSGPERIRARDLDRRILRERKGGRPRHPFVKPRLIGKRNIWRGRGSAREPLNHDLRSSERRSFEVKVRGQET